MILHSHKLTCAYHQCQNPHKKAIPLLHSIFTNLFHPYFFTKSSLQYPLTFPSSIPQQFSTSLFLHTPNPIIYTKNIFSTSVILPIYSASMHQGVVRGLVRSETILISSFFLKVWKVITGLTITDSLLLRLRKLVYCWCGKPLNPTSLIPSNYCHYFHILLIPPEELTFP